MASGGSSGAVGIMDSGGSSDASWTYNHVTGVYKKRWCKVYMDSWWSAEKQTMVRVIWWCAIVVETADALHVEEEWKWDYVAEEADPPAASAALSNYAC